MTRLISPVLASSLSIALSMTLAIVLFTQQSAYAKSVKSPLIGKPMPEFSAPGLPPHRQRLTHTVLQEKEGIKILNFWASWCAQCVAEHPNMFKLSKVVPVYSITYQDAPKDSQKFLKKLGDPFTHIGVDRKGRVAKKWGFRNTPETYVIDAKGIVRQKYVGMIDDEHVEAILEFIKNSKEN